MFYPIQDSIVDHSAVTDFVVCVELLLSSIFFCEKESDFLSYLDFM